LGGGRDYQLQRRLDPAGPAYFVVFFGSQPIKLWQHMNDINLMLQAVQRGEKPSSEELLPAMYDELRRLATLRMAQQAAGHTLQPTALVHEAWLRLMNDGARSWQNRAHFFGAASEAMRRILVESARRKARLKHGGGQERMNIDSLEIARAPADENVLLINEALEQLEALDAERARVVVLKYFGGLTNEEVAQNLGISERSVDRQWCFAKAWLLSWIRKHR
jgi:RNA polymerase sigma factor (TIGR02999 family)